VIRGYPIMLDGAPLARTTPCGATHVGPSNGQIPVNELAQVLMWTTSGIGRSGLKNRIPYLMWRRR
jgi:hypothetical protein